MNRLKQLQQWICWNLKTKDGRATKVPCAAGGGATGTDPAHASTWVTWQEAVSATQARQYTGIGFVIPQGYFFLDVDHKELTDPLVQALLNRFNTYAERSFSGNGLHIYGRCDLTRLPIQDGKLARCYYDGKYILGNGEFPITEMTYKRSWERICRTINMHGATAHVLRHTYITMAAAHLDIKTLQTIAGHSDISTTMNRYAHGREDKIIQAGGLLKDMYG